MTDRNPDVQLEFANDQWAPCLAREAVSALFVGPEDPIADAVTLTTSELVSNVVRHTGGGGVIRVWDPKPDVPLRIEVQDHDLTIPAIVGSPTVGGFGLRIVSEVADAWGVAPTTDGKVVWAEFNRPVQK